MSPGQWRDPSDKGTTKDSLDYWINLAKLAEEGKISFIFFADGYTTHEVYEGTSESMLRAGTQFATIDLMTVIPAMAAVTKTLGFGITGSTSYLTTFILWRTFSSLDHLTKGRIAWNVVTSWSKSTAKALGAEDVIPHDERYAMAHEYMDMMYKLWESSWADDSVVWDRERRVAFERSKVKRIEHQGKYFKMSARGDTHPSPQRTPVIFQAGTSTAGRAFASKHAEAIYVGGLIPAQTKGSIAAIRTAAAERGRNPASLKFFVGISPILGATLEEAQAKYERAKEYADVIGGLAQFSGYTGIDLSRFPLNDVFELKDAPGDDAVHSFLENFNKVSGNTEPWTPRLLGEKMALGGFHPAPVGTPAMVADVFEQWIDEADVDGFNIAYITTPGSFEDIVYLLRPELVKRGLMWEDYTVPGGTLRENLTGVKGQKGISSDHYAAKFKYGSGFEGDSIEALKAVEPKTNGVNGKLPVLNGKPPATVAEEEVKA
ncbi:bacterial luciferase-like protein [Mytilinidion resinicola]|uniref:Bacterial luciferase-like protein n=1 Tax=Mytilinidion resinicola TaxID=574789 RepID=A0A6A6YI26_9PEZI|nr:bacterial luciferase-like protein [Mytilinidion resinicola]KAF2808492.1 bacterial luciferase-like protein [Mytilinidion resinicola]